MPKDKTESDTETGAEEYPLLDLRLTGELAFGDVVWQPPTLGQYRDMRKHFVETIAQARDAATTTEGANEYDTTLRAEEWAMLADKLVGSGTLTADNIPAWVANNNNFAATALAHWRNIPLVPGS